MELHQVQYFLALARSLNFTRAAEHCNVTQPALTKAVQKLEQELGGPLIHRERQLTQLTDLGKLVLPMAERMFAAAESVRSQAHQFQHKTIAPLKIGLSPCVSASIVTPSLSEVARTIPGLQVELIDAAAERLPDLLLSGEINAALTGDLEGYPDRLNHWPLFEERFVVLAAHDHPIARLGCPATITIAGPATIRVAGSAPRQGQSSGGAKPRPETGPGGCGFLIAPCPRGRPAV